MIHPQDLQTGIDYWNGKITTTPIVGNFRASRKADVQKVPGTGAWHLFVFDQSRRYEQIAIDSLLNGEGVVAVLKAGASSRMNTAAAPEEVKKMVGGRTILSKAAVPIGMVEGDVINYDDAFNFSIAKLLKSLHSPSSRIFENDILSLTNDEYRREHEDILRRRQFYGLQQKQFRFIHQPLGVTFEATPKDVERLHESGEFKNDDEYRAALNCALEVEKKFRQGNTQAIVAPDRDPLGHGEFFHELILSGEFLHVIDTKKKWIFLRNIDNYAAKFDRVWLRILGKFLADKLDFQPEVSPRAPAQEGGGLIVKTDIHRHELTEDPNLRETKALGHTKVNPQDNYWINNAVCLMSPRYVINIYKKPSQSDEDFIQELRKANQDERIQIVHRGRQKFPKILAPKKAKLTQGVKIKVETNLWQSTGIVDKTIKIKAIGVVGGRNFKINEYPRLTDEQKKKALSELRFLATKHWDRSGEEKRRLREKMDSAYGHSVTDEELALTLESYEGNKLLSQDLLKYILTTEV